MEAGWLAMMQDNLLEGIAAPKVLAELMPW